MTLYINGLPVNSTTANQFLAWTGAPNSGTALGFIEGGMNPLNGLIDNAELYDCAVTPALINATYQYEAANPTLGGMQAPITLRLYVID